MDEKKKFRLTNEERKKAENIIERKEKSKKYKEKLEQKLEKIKKRKIEETPLLFEKEEQSNEPNEYKRVKWDIDETEQKLYQVEKKKRKLDEEIYSAKWTDSNIKEAEEKLEFTEIMRIPNNERYLLINL
jgi:hypothetical protein